MPLQVSAHTDYAASDCESSCPTVPSGTQRARLSSSMETLVSATTKAGLIMAKLPGPMPEWAMLGPTPKGRGRDDGVSQQRNQARTLLQMRGTR